LSDVGLCAADLFASISEYHVAAIHLFVLFASPSKALAANEKIFPKTLKASVRANNNRCCIVNQFFGYTNILKKNKKQEMLHHQKTNLNAKKLNNHHQFAAISQIEI